MEGREKHRKGDSIEYGIQSPMGPDSGERRARSDNLGKGESMDGPGSYGSIARGVVQQKGKPGGSIYRDGTGGVPYSKPGHETKGLYPVAQKKGLSNGVVGGPSGASKGYDSPYAPKSGTMPSKDKALPGGVYPAQKKGYKGKG